MIGLRITLTKKANKDEAAIYEYIFKTFGERHAEAFRKKIFDIFNILSKQPFIGRPAKNKATLRVYLLSKQNKIVYKVTEDSLSIIRILNTKTNLAGKF